MRVEQAIFTSIRNGRLSGYQLVASSPGITRDEARELSRWGPAHDSMWDGRQGATCVNFHPLRSGVFCLSQTTAAGAEYSARGGVRVYTHYLLASPATLQRFANHPFRLLEAARESGQLAVQDPLPKQLEPCLLTGSRRVVDADRIARSMCALGADKLAVLLASAISARSLGFLSRIRPERVVESLLDLLPPQCRCQFSFSSGLRFTPRRPFRLLALPQDPLERRRTVRQSDLAMLDLTAEPPVAPATLDGWAGLVWDVLRRQRITLMSRVLRQAAEDGGNDLNRLSAVLRDRFPTSVGRPASPRALP